MLDATQSSGSRKRTLPFCSLCAQSKAPSGRRVNCGCWLTGVVVIEVVVPVAQSNNYSPDRHSRTPRKIDPLRNMVMWRSKKGCRFCSSNLVFHEAPIRDTRIVLSHTRCRCAAWNYVCLFLASPSATCICCCRMPSLVDA